MQLLSEYRAHRRTEWDTELELVETEISSVGIHDAVVVVHREHQRSGEGVPVDESESGHGVRKEPPPKSVQRGGKEIRRVRRVLEIEAIAKLHERDASVPRTRNRLPVELCDRARGNNDTLLVPVLNQVEGREQRLTEVLGAISPCFRHQPPFLMLTDVRRLSGGEFKVRMYIFSAGFVHVTMGFRESAGTVKRVDVGEVLWDMVRG